MAIFSIPIFGFWLVRMHLLTQGRMPLTAALPLHWYDTPYIHLCTILDFVELCRQTGVTIERGFAITATGRPSPIRRSEEHTSELQSLMRISYAVFCLKKKT